MGCSPLVLVCAIAAALVAAPVEAKPKPAAEVVFKGAPPEAVAPLLASECTRRRMALIRNTPERVVCKRPLAILAKGSDAINELWSFALHPISRGRTKVQAHASLEGAAPQGYAVLSFKDTSPEAKVAMRGFMETVRDGGFWGALRR